MNGEAAEAYVHTIAEAADNAVRMRTLSRMCIDFGADVGRLDRPMPSYLEALVREGRANGAHIPPWDDYSDGALVGVGGIAAGISDDGAAARRPRPVRGRLTPLHGAARQVGRHLVCLDPFAARRTMVEIAATTGPTGTGATDAVRLVVDAYEGAVAGWATRTGSVDRMPETVVMLLLLDSLTVDALACAFDRPEAAEHPVSSVDAQVLVAKAVKRLCSKGQVTDDLDQLKAAYGKVVPAGSVGLTVAGRNALADRLRAQRQPTNGKVDAEKAATNGRGFARQKVRAAPSG